MTLTSGPTVRRRRVRTPTVLQAQTTECGVAALAMILGHHGRHVRLDELRQVAGVSRDGSTAAELIRAAGHYGLAARAFKVEPEGLAALGFPLIVHMSFIHYVVVEGMARGKVHVNDPALGRVALPSETFAERFTGVALTFSPAESFRPDGRPDSPWSALRRRFGAQRWPLALAGVAGLLAVVPTLLAADLLRGLVDGIGAGAGRRALVPLAVALAGSAVVRAMLGALREGCLARVRTRDAEARGGAFLRHLLRLPFSFFVYRTPGTLYGLVGSDEALPDLVCGRLLTTAVAALTLPALAVALVAYDPLAALLVVATAGLGALVVDRMGDREAGLARRYGAAAGTAAGLAAEQIDHLESYKTGGRDEELFSCLAGGHAAEQRAREELEGVRGWTALVPEAVEAACLVAVLVAGGLGVLQGRLTPGAVAASLFLATSLLSALRVWLADGQAPARLRPLLMRLDEVESLPEEPDVVPGRSAEARGSGAHVLALDDVVFGYATHKPPLIEAASLEIRRGAQVAIVGATASGKSTLAGLLVGLHRPWSGRVELWGRPLEALPRSEIARSVAWVDSRPFLFAGTVRENLSLWDGSLSEADLAAAVRDACLDDVLAGRLGGLDGPVAPDGANFSGGQRQRLEIARALARDPALIVVDGGFDALEPDLEAAIRANLRRRGSALIVVSQRSSTIEACDQVVLLTEGRLVPREAMSSAPGAPLPVVPSTSPPPGSDGAVDAAPRPDASALRAAFQLFAEAAGGRPPGGVDADAGDALPSMAERSGLRLRRVRLAPSGWWRADHGPLLASFEGSGSPVALLPAPGGGYLVADSSGRRRLTAADATRLRGEAFAPYPRLPDGVRRPADLIGAAARASRRELLVGAVVASVTAATAVAWPLAVVALFRGAGAGRGIGSAAASLSLVAAAALALGRTLAAARRRLEGRLDLVLLSGAWDRLIRLPVPSLRRLSREELIRRMDGARDLGASLGGAALGGLANVAAVVGSLAVLAWIAPPLGLVGLGLLLPALVVPALLAWRTGPLQEAHFRQSLRNHEFLVGALHAIGRLRVASSEARAAEHWRRGDRTEKWLAARLRRRVALGTLFRDAYPLAALAGMAVALAALGPAAPDAAGLLGVLVGFLHGLSAAQAAGPGAASWALARSEMEQLRPLLATEPEPSGGHRPAEGLRGAVEVRDISFRYEDAATPALDGVSLRAEPGEMVAIVGPSGGGKSTLLRVLLGFERPQRGEVAYDGRALAEWDLPALRSRLGAVLQDDRLEPGTARFNLSGRSCHDLAEVWDAAAVAAIDADIRAWPMGMQTLVAEAKLSTGQKQRLLIAARVLRRPRVLLLDEATSAFDEGLQAEVLRNLKALGITCLCVTHRASTIALADRVYVIQGGRVVQEGTPSDLFAQDGPLARLHADQRASRPSGTSPSRGREAAADRPAPRADAIFRRAALDRFEGPVEMDELPTFPAPRPRSLDRLLARIVG